jgi:hypothetical protein
MIKKLVIDRLRGFAHFELHDLGRVNLLVGTNNSGKTTVLEGIQMLSVPGDLYSILRILSRRGEDWWDTTERGRGSRHLDIRRLFSGHEIKRGSRFDIQGVINGRARKFAAEIIDAPKPANAQPSLFEGDSGTAEGDDFLPPSALRLAWDELPDLDFPIGLNRRGGVAIDTLRRAASGIESEGKARFITTASLAPEAVIELFETIVLTPEEDLVVDALKIIEPSIERIATSGSDRMRSGYPDTARGGVLVRCAGVKNRIPIGSMGDGIWRMLGVALALVRSEGGVLLIDEIDTGLHFKVMADLWRLIYKTAKRLNVQVFATTHSRDCYESLAVLCREQVSDGSDITIQRIERNRKVAVGYTEQEIIAAADRGMEVR